MSKAFGILLIVAAAWVGMEFYTEGSRNAFGGAFASIFENEQAPAPDAPRLSTPQRAGAAVERAHREGEARYDRMLDE